MRNLYPYQLDGAAFLRSRRRAALFDEMRVGKTCQALVALPERARAVVVCPAIAKSVWEFEAAKFRPDFRVRVLSGLGSFRWPEEDELVVLNYELLPERPPPKPAAHVWAIADEAHYLKSPKSHRSTRWRNLHLASNSTWLLTGTPLLRLPPDLWYVLRAAGLELEAFGDWWRFRQGFQAKEREVWVAGGRKRRVIEWGKPLPWVRDAVAKVALRRRRADVLPWLPEKARRRLRVECLTKETSALCDEALAALPEGRDPEAALEAVMDAGGLDFQRITQTRAALAVLKIKGAGELLDDLEAADRRVVLFSAHRAPVEALVASRPRWAAILGGTPDWQRRAAIQGFQGGRFLGIGATIQAAGTGINLTAATDVVFVDQDWSPMLNLQAEDRVCGPGQKGGVLVTVLEADHKLDAIVSAVIRRKMRVAEAAIG